MMMIMMIRIINERKLRMIIRVNKIITLTMKTMRVARLIMRMAGKNDNENDQSNESDRSKHNNNNKVKKNQNSKSDNNNYKNENQCNDDRKTIMITMIRMARMKIIEMRISMVI